MMPSPGSRGLRRCPGVSLVELIVFIVVVAIMATALFSVFAGAVSGVTRLGEAGRANLIAQQRLELVLLRKRQSASFADFLLAPDPCFGGTPPAVCAVPPGYTVVPAQVQASAFGADFREIIVQVQGESDATLRTVVASF
ncbi:MAG: type II secretion system GspH family protein [Gammaproteobacteria bacterium]|nr:type II secretion system GspH family protein [Gammaproteobacteria bacterium]